MVKRRCPSKRKITRNTLFADYYETWIHLYKKDLVTPITYRKYTLALKQIREYLPNVKMKDMDRNKYQDLLNEYGETREQRTVKGFKDLTSRALKDAFYNGLIKKDPTYSIVIKGIPKQETGNSKFLNEAELKRLVDHLVFDKELSFDWLLYLMIVTGTRYQEALAITPADFDYRKGEIRINKAWNYKSEQGGFTKTKNKSSVRKIYVGQHILNDFKTLVEDMPKEDAIFASKRVKVQGGSSIILRHNATSNDKLKEYCREAGIPDITLHSLRHTYASVLLAGGVSMLSVSHQLGHGSTTTTSKVYAHQTNKMKSTEQKRLNQVFGKN